MSFRDFFNVSRAVGPLESIPDTGRGAPPAAPTQGAFVTPQSLTSFLGASGVVALLWKVAGLLVHSWANNLGVAFVCALLVGAFLFYMSESDPARGPIKGRDYVIDGAIGFLNVLVLFSAAIGGTATISNVVSSTTTPPVEANKAL